MRRLKLNLSLLHKRNHSEMEGQDDEFDLDKVKAQKELFRMIMKN